MLCPRDGTALTQSPDVLGPKTEGQVCPRCAGVMLDWKTAQAFLSTLGVTVQDLHELVARAARSQRPASPAACTACGTGAMKPFVLQGTELDVCEACGAVWLDRAELSRLTQGALGAQLAPTPAAGETSAVAGVFEMWWDCGHCEAKGLLGKSHRYCPRCGAPQDPARRYFPPEGQETPAGAEYLGADLTCPACGTPNGARANNCGHCGSPLSGAAEVAKVADRSSAAPKAGAAPAPSRRRLWPYLLGLIATVSCGVCGAALFWTKDVAVTVTGHTWSREVDVEQLAPVREDAWCDSMPSGAYSVSRTREQRSSKQVADGEECTTRDVDRGDGTFERRRECRPKYRDEPVYGDRCHFTIDRWKKQRTEAATGRGVAPAPRWPDLRLTRGGCGAVGCEREGARREVYTLELRGADAKVYECEVSGERWLRVADGVQRPIPVGVLTGLPECDRL